MKKDQASTEMGGSSMTASSSSAGTTGQSGNMQSSQGTQGMQGGQDMAMAPNAVVISIEPAARESAMSGSSTAGTTGSSSTATGSDQVHRVSVRMDDGSMVSIVQETAPTFKSGDRVHVSNSTIHQR